MRRSPIPVAIALALLVGLGGCAKPAGQVEAANVSKSAATFTCCRSADVDPVRHPGETFPIHWIMRLTPAPKDVPTQQIVLKVSLSDAYDSVENLKNSETKGASVTSRSDSVTTSSAATTAPVSEITVPETAQPGFYNLTSSVETDGTIVSGSAVIHVEAAEDSP